MVYRLASVAFMSQLCQLPTRAGFDSRYRKKMIFFANSFFLLDVLFARSSKLKSYATHNV